MKTFLNNLLKKAISLLPHQIQELATAEGGIERYTKNFGWMFAIRLITFPLSFAVLAVVTRYLGPEKFGLWSYALSFSAIFSTLASLGINQVLYRDLVEEPKNKESLLGSAFVVRLVAGFVCFLALTITAFLIEADPFARTLIIIVGSSFLIDPFRVLNNYFKSRVLSKYSAISILTVFITASVLKVGFAFGGLSVLWFAVISIIESVVYLASFIYFYNYLGHSVWNWSFQWKTAQSLLSSSWPLFFSGIFVTLYSRIDQIILKQLAGETAVGLYGAAARVGEFWYVIPGLVVSSLFPAIVNAKKTNQGLYAKRLFALFGTITAGALIIAGIIAVSAGIIVPVIFGQQFTGSIGVLRIYAFAGVAIAGWKVIERYLLAEDFTKVVLWCTIIGAVTNIGLNFILIPTYGPEGAAIATVISYTAVPISILLFKKTRHDTATLTNKIIAKFRSQN